MNRGVAILVAAGFVALALAGCAQPSTNPLPAQISFGRECPETLTCTEQNGIHVSGHLEAEDGLSLLVGTNMTFTDFSLESQGNGLDILFVGDCRCSLTFRNMTLTGAGETGLDVWPSMIGTDLASADVVLENIYVSGFGRGLAVTIPGSVHYDGVHVDCVEEGILQLLAAPMTMNNTQIDGCSQRGLTAQGYGTATVANSQFRNSGLGAWFNTGSFRIDPLPTATTTNLEFTNVTFDGNGLGLRTSDTAFLTDSFVTNNGAPSAWLDDEGLPPGGIRADDNGMARNVHFEGNTGFALSAGLQVFDATNNWWGATTGPTPSAVEPVAQSPIGDWVHARVQYVPFLTSPP